ncbi:MAG: 30S ribosomal protein S6 [Desulfobacterota bacterium]|nr:30S ribosomal protein S6 [Thermodesulfobacteriota bacterium]MDW8001625.1 30S ribosomal protein S6 [Deltaproteobacteria bacterium]
MPRYENIIILNPETPKEEKEELLKRVRTNIEKTGAKIIRFDDWEVRKLAYSIKKMDRGHYFYILFDAQKEAIPQLDRFYKTQDNLLRHLFVRVDDTEEGPKTVPEQVIFDELEGEYS